MVDIKIREINEEIFKNYGHTNGMEEGTCTIAYRRPALQQTFSPITTAEHSAPYSHNSQQASRNTNLHYTNPANAVTPDFLNTLRTGGVI
jgi:hypothetical protein